MGLPAANDRGDDAEVAQPGVGRRADDDLRDLSAGHLADRDDVAW